MSNYHYIISRGRNQLFPYTFSVVLNMVDLHQGWITSGTSDVISAREIRKLDVYFRKQLDPIGDRGWQ